MTSPTFNNNAFEMLRSLLRQWGLASLEGDVRDMLTAGDTEDVIPIKLRETKAYKERFAGNAARTKNGYAALSEAEYLATEDRLQTVIRRYVGSGTYDTKANLEKWISSDVSPQELNDRMVIYQEAYQRWGQMERDAWANQGFTPADAIKALMDPKVDENTLKRNAQIYSLGAASVQAYRDDRALDRTRLDRMASAGVSADEALRGYREVAGREQREGFLARIYGEQLTREEQEDAALLGDQQAEQKRRRVIRSEQGKFDENYMGGQAQAARSVAGSY